MPLAAIIFSCGGAPGSRCCLKFAGIALRSAAVLSTCKDIRSSFGMGHLILYTTRALLSLFCARVFAKDR